MMTGIAKEETGPPLMAIETKGGIDCLRKFLAARGKQEQTKSAFR